MNNLINFDVKIKYNKNKEIPKKVFAFFDRFVKCGVWGATARQQIKRRKGTGRGTIKAFKIGQLAYQNEFGYEYTVKKDVIFDNPKDSKKHYRIKAGTKIKVPARPAFRHMASDSTHKAKIGRTAQEAVAKLLKGGAVRQSWKMIGDSSLKELRESYSSGKFAENSKLTATLKGMNFPLVDTFGVYGALHYKILSGSKESNKQAKRAFNKRVKFRTENTLSKLRG